VFDLIGGLATWTAFGMPTSGTCGDRHRILHHVEQVATAPFTGTVADLPAPGATGADRTIAVVAPNGVVVGAVDPRTTPMLPTTTRLRDVLVPAPGTIRPEQPVEAVAAQLRDDGIGHVLVTTAGGVLLGIVVAERLHV
jgi:CBS domain-containing protein